MSETQWPEGATKKITLETGRVIFLRKPKFSDIRQATMAANPSSGSFDPLGYMMEMTQLLVVELRRNNGEKVDLTNKATFFDKTLTFEEGQQLLQNPEVLGLELKKNPPKVEDRG